MTRSSKQSSTLNSQFIIALLLVFEAVVCAEVGSQQQNKPEHLNQQDLSKQTASILSNYHSDAETLLRSNDLEKKEEQQPIVEKKPKPVDAQSRITKLPKFEEQLKLVKRSPRNYNFGLGRLAFSLFLLNTSLTNLSILLICFSTALFFPPKKANAVQNKSC